MDLSGDPTVDRIVRPLDTVDMKIDWSLLTVPGGGFTSGGQPADSNVTITATLPLASNGQPAAFWTAVPTDCYLTSSGVMPTIAPLSAISNGSRTLTCNLGHKAQASSGFFDAFFRVSGFATDGTRIDVAATIQADTTRAAANPATSASTQTFWSSARANYNLRLDQQTWDVSANAFGPAQEAGRYVTLVAQVLQPRGTETIGSSTCCATGQPFQFDVDLARFGSAAAADGNPGTLASRARLYNWNGATGCNGASFVCTQAGGVGTNIHVKAYALSTGANNPNNSTGFSSSISSSRMSWVSARTPTTRASNSLTAMERLNRSSS